MSRAPSSVPSWALPSSLSSSSEAADADNDLTFGSGASAEEEEPSWAAEAARHERFLLQQPQGGRPGMSSDPHSYDEEAWNRSTFDDMAEWQDPTDSATDRGGGGRIDEDDGGGDEVDVNVRLYGILQGRDADLLSRGSISLSGLHSSHPIAPPPSSAFSYGEEEMDSSMLDSVLKALEEEEEEDEVKEAEEAMKALQPIPQYEGGVMGVEELERQLRGSRGLEGDVSAVSASPLSPSVPSPQSNDSSPSLPPSASPSPPTGTISVPLPPDHFSSAPPVYIPLPARHFSAIKKNELAFIIKMQLNQLQAQSGSEEDAFYSQVWQMRKGKRQLSRSLQQMPPILQQRKLEELKGEGVNTAPSSSSFAALLSGKSGALGRIALSSLKKPKKLMELAPSNTNSTQEVPHIITRHHITPGVYTDSSPLTLSSFHLAMLCHPSCVV